MCVHMWAAMYSYMRCDARAVWAPLLRSRETGALLLLLLLTSCPFAPAACLPACLAWAQRSRKGEGAADAGVAVGVMGVDEGEGNEVMRQSCELLQLQKLWPARGI